MADQEDAARAGHATHAPPAGFGRTGGGDGPEDLRTVRFVSATGRVAARAPLERRRVLVIDTGPLEASGRGRLSDVIDDAVERELGARGAASPGIGAGSDADAALSDQLFRLRNTGASGLALMIGSLRAATGAKLALEPEDSATLRFWSAACREGRVLLFLDAADAALPAYAEPRRLDAVLGGKPASGVAMPPAHPAAPVVPRPEPRPLAGVSVAGDHDVWRGFTLALAAARGPQPLPVFERLFAHDYLPLANAIAGGLDDPRAVHAHAEFRRTFARAYFEACPTFAVTGKRPKMVLDAPEVAARIARLHGARTTQLLLVDALRFDVGALLRDALVRGFGPRAAMTDEMILWSALPTTSLRQLETLSRGVEALRTPPAPDAERETETLRGRTAEMIRRVKIGPRDVFKLDLVQARLHEECARPQPDFAPLAAAAADAIVRHAATLHPRTLLFVFGDHGFTVEKGVAHSGGASPEEVLVPAFAFLLGEVH